MCGWGAMRHAWRHSLVALLPQIGDFELRYTSMVSEFFWSWNRVLVRWCQRCWMSTSRCMGRWKGRPQGHRNGRRFGHRKAPSQPTFRPSAARMRPEWASAGTRCKWRVQDSSVLMNSHDIRYNDPYDDNTMIQWYDDNPLELGGSLVSDHPYA